MFQKSSKFIQRISRLLIIMQVGLLAWNGQPVMAQADQVQSPPTSPEANALNYSQTHALVLTGEDKESDGSFASDSNGNLTEYRNTMTDFDEVVDRALYEARGYNEHTYTAFRKTPAYSSLRSGRYGHSATLLKDGRVLIAGGANSVGPLSTSVIYDPATNRMTPGPRMNVARIWHSATLLPSGDVLILGGKTWGDESRSDAEQICQKLKDSDPSAYAVRCNQKEGSSDIYGGKGTTPSGEIYSVKNNTFVSLDSWYSQTYWHSTEMLRPRARHTATYLPNTNKVLVVGYNEEAVSNDASSYYSPVNDSISLGCDRGKKEAGFTAPFQSNPEVRSAARVSCWVDNPNINPGETTTLQVTIDLEGNPGDWGVSTSMATVSLATSDDLSIQNPNKILGIFPLGRNVKRTTRKVNPFSKDITERQLNFYIARADATSKSSGVQEITLNVTLGKQKRSYSELIVGQHTNRSQEATSTPPSQYATDNFLVYYYTNRKDSEYDGFSPSGVDSQACRSIRSLGHNCYSAKREEKLILNKYASEQTTPFTLYATNQATLNNSLSELNRVAHDIGARVEPKFIITEKLSTFRPPDGILVINSNIIQNSPYEGITDTRDWEDPEGLFAEVINLSTGESTPLPESIAPSRQSSVYALPDGRAIITGGNLSKVYLYTPDSNRVSIIGTLTLPRQDMQVLPLLNGSGNPTALYFVGGSPLNQEVSDKIAELLSKGQLPADILDLSSMRMNDAPTSLPTITGSLSDQVESIRSDVQKAYEDYQKSQSKSSNVVKRGSTAERITVPSFTKFAKEYAKKHKVSPLAVQEAFNQSGTQTVGVKYAAKVAPNKYLIVSPTSAAVWDLENKQIEPLLIPTRIPVTKYAYINNFRREGFSPHYVEPRITEKLGTSVISDQSTFGWDYDGGQITALNDGTVLVSGGMSGVGKYVDGPNPTNYAKSFAHMVNVVGIGATSGMAFAGMMYNSPLVAVAGLIAFLYVAAFDLMNAVIRSTDGIFSGGSSKPTKTYAKTATSVWRFMLDPYPNETTEDQSGEVVREDTKNPDMLAPPKEALASSKPAPDQQIAGKNSNYKLDLSFDQTKLSPYPGATVTGTIKLVDASGRTVPMDGGVTLVVGAGNSSLGTRVEPYDFGASETYEVITRTDSSVWSTSAPGAFYNSDFASRQGVGTVTSGGTTGSWKLAGEDSHNLLLGPNVGGSDGSGKLIFEKSVIGSSPTVLLKNGVGTFTYQAGPHKYDHVSFAVMGKEQPVFKPRDPRYQPYYNCSSCEPADVRDQRISAPVGYQVVSQNNLNTVLHNSQDKPAVEPSSIATVKTLSFADPKTTPPPKLSPQESLSQVDYFYDITTSGPVKPKQGDKLQITVTPKAKPGKTIPADIYNGINLQVMAGYQIYNKFYRDPNTGKTGGFIVTYPLKIVKDNSTNQAVSGGWTTLDPDDIHQWMFNIGTKPVTFELEYTGEPTQTPYVSFLMKVSDERCIPTDQRFGANRLKYTGKCQLSSDHPQIMQTVTNFSIQK